MLKYLVILEVMGGGCCGQKGPFIRYAMAYVEEDKVVSVTPVYQTAIQLTRHGHWDGYAEGLSQEQLQDIYTLLGKDKEMRRKKSYTIRGMK